ncbi:MAG: hypothetical protein R3B82_19700 [Sandaracinaceae bacterium]
MRGPLAALALGVLAACGPPSTGSGPRPHVATRGGPSRVTSEAHREPRPSGRPFAATPITGVADELTDLAVAVAEGRPLPETHLPLRSPLGETPQARWFTERPIGGTTVIGIAFELELILKRGVPDDDAAPAERWGSLRLTLALSRNGLRVYSVRPRTMSRALPGGPLPPAMEGFATVAAEIVGALRAGDVSAYALDERDRELLQNDEAWLQVQDERVRPELVTQIQTMLATLPDAPLAYRLDDVAVLLVDHDERLLGYAMSWEPEGERFVLTTEPLVEARQLWPR